MITIANGTVLCGVDLVAKNVNLLIDDGKIIEISKEVLEGKIIDATNYIVCPTFLNAHVHIGDSVVKDMGDGKTIEEIVKPPNGLKHLALKNASDEDIINSMKTSMKEMLRTGTTHFIDYREGGIKGIKLLKKAAKDIPINPIILGRDDIFHEEDPDLSKVKIAIRKLLKICDGIAPSGFGELNDEVASLIAFECKKMNKISSIHTGEYENLQNDSLKKTGKTEVQRAINFGFDQLIHVTAPLNNDLDLIKCFEKNIVLCPRSNGAFSVGIPPLLDIIKRKIKPLIGTDNIMINSPNIFREMEFTLKMMRGFYKEYVSPLEILKMSTTNISSSVYNCDYMGNNENNDKEYLDVNIDKKNIFPTNISEKINKSIIQEENNAELFLSRKLSENPYLSLINRTEIKDIICLLNKDKLIYYD
ncbi:amidohydrolase family protein [Methanobrevibacter sp.]|uniref:amidohydrolase family protein n=1 Tax=Methanobrevibacter sp. TaxID=66852 RepID=UPI002602C24A|nr:amidohydrolase family protein [uncultured Methanobrevibacter sp.]